MAENEAYLAAEEKIERAICSKTQHLDLSVNWTADADPLTVVPESISDLPWLKSLNLSGNHLVNLPDSISRLTQLKTLNVTRCMLSDLPNWLIEMPNLVSLELGSNRFGELPDELGRMVQLQSLNLSSVFAKLPESLGNLENLHLLEIDHNSLTRLPDWIRKLTGLQSLAVNHNIIEDVPDWIGELSGLEFLVLAGNRISQLPASIGNLICLQSLDLFTNRFDHIPEGVFLLKNLEKLSISHNRIHSISDDIGELKRLRELYAAENLFERLPRSIGNLVELRTLILGGKQLSSGWTRQPEMGGSLSELPLEIVNLPSLYDLNLDGNPLNPELAAAYDEGMEAVKRYLIAKADAQVSLNEAKLILVGEGEVGKSCLLGALRGDPWMDDRPTTHDPIHLQKPRPAGLFALWARSLLLALRWGKPPYVPSDILYTVSRTPR
ncbi:MAG: hypothetical protein EOP06_11745 [Proteobacteria bacterium]|nr:MAG: hypothetical protein EOP06_11745 [Pseudomonadota bacterium]